MWWIAVMIVVVACSVYIGASILFLKKPHLIRKPVPKLHVFDKCTHISHRGGAGEHLENTLTAFRHAVAVGTQMLELDCQLTADDQVVVCHDPQLARVAGVEGEISDYTYRDLPNLLIDPEKPFHKNFLDQMDTRIPLLKEVFSEFREIPINIDVKTENPKLLKLVHRLIKQFHRENSVVWGNFRHSVCKSCHEADPTIPLLVSLRRVVQLYLCFYTGILPYIAIKEHFLEIPMLRALVRPDAPFKPTGFQKFILSTVDTLMMRKAFFDHLKKRGIDVYLWVLNTEEDWDRAFALGACGVMTDFPARLSEYLRDRNMNLTNTIDSGSYSDLVE